MCDTGYINHVGNNASTDVFRCLDKDFCTSLPEVESKNIDTIRSMICWRINRTGMNLVMAQPHNNQGSFDEDFLDYILEQLHQQKTFPSGRNGSVRVDALRQSRQRHPGGGLLHARPSLPRVALHIALWTLFRRFFSLCRSPNLNKHSGVVANCDHTSECVHWVHACIRIAMQCDAAKISPRVPSTLSSRSVGRWEDMILPGREDPRNCVDPRNLGKSEWNQKLGKIECVFSLYDKMRWKRDAFYLPRGLPNIYSVSLIPPPLPLYLRTPTVAS